jgi:DNA repair protein RadA/Sms
MTRAHAVHRCAECGAEAPRWVGRCPGCGGWNTLVEEVVPPVAAIGPRPEPAARPLPIGDVTSGSAAPRPTGLAEVDRVLGGGLVPGSVTLLGGEPGVGKSTLLLQVLAHLAQQARCLLVAAEESPEQVRLRAGRLATLPPDLWLVAETDVANVLTHVEHTQPRYLVVDSVQAIADPEVGGVPGSVTQVRACAHRLVRVAKEQGVTAVLVGHVTKDGSLAGPRALEHLVDTVLSFGGDHHHALRLLRATKHRFGPTTELGLFEMGERGLAGVADAGHLFLSDRRVGVAGSAVAAALDGRRPLLVELQALVNRLPSGSQLPPRRSAQGVDAGRLSLVLAVLDRRASVRAGQSDVYVSAVGGARVADPAADLPLALALTSAVSGAAVPADVVACGEVGLGGELRQVPHMAQRMAEAERLGFRRAIVPATAPPWSGALRAMPAHTLADAIRLAGVGPPSAARRPRVA